MSVELQGGFGDGDVVAFVQHSFGMVDGGSPDERCPWLVMSSRVPSGLDPAAEGMGEVGVHDGRDRLVEPGENRPEVGEQRRRRGR